MPRSEIVVHPRNGVALRVGIVCRISGCTNQKELSLDDQEDNAKEAVADLYEGPVDYEVIATKGKGERLDRPELEQVEAAYRSGTYDLFVYDDLSRLVRGTEAARLLGVGVDHGTRSICINDGIDTADESWEVDAINACSESVAHNERTSKRIKQKNMNRFKKFGGAMARPIYGYILPEGAKTYDDWQKAPEAERFIVEGARLLRSTLSGAVVADYFNANNVPVGPYARSDRWNGTMVLRFYRNSLLKGVAFRGRNHTVKVHETGRRVQKRNPKGATFYECPHLAYFAADEFDELVELLHKSNAAYRRKSHNGVDVRANVPRKRTRFPGQHARCWYCGRIYHWGGNGLAGHLMCSGSHSYSCWNSIHIDGKIATERVLAAINDTLYQLDGFDAQFRSMVKSSVRTASGTNQDQLHEVDSQQQLIDRESANLLKAFKSFGTSPLLENELRELEQRRRELELRRRWLERNQVAPPQLPQSAAELRARYEQAFKALNDDTPEFGTLLQKIVPEFEVHLVRLVDGGHPLPRARLKLDFGGMIADAVRVPGFSSLLTREVTVDLFDPPQRERIRETATQLRAEGLHLKQIAARIEERPSTTAVQHALALQQAMNDAGTNTPYLPLFEPPQDYGKLRRHKHLRYRFAPMDGYQRRPI
ncbi:MAG: recombinase family protein [Planctomycetaceae bacterium]|nr:recombinase family protein [Planctomycetaceae bacterium]